MTTSYKDTVIESVFAMYKNKWTRLWDLNNVEYNPIENYSMEEKHTGNDTQLKTPTNWKTSTDHKVSQDYKEVDSQKPTNWKETLDHKVSEGFKEVDSQKPSTWKKTTETEGTPDSDNSSVTMNDVIPYNGTDFAHVAKSKTVNTSKIAETQSGTFDVEHTQTGTRTEEKTQSGTFDTEHTQTGTRTEETTQSGTFEDKTTYNSTLTRAGNIGTTTSQMMAQSEINLWQWLYFEDVFKDIDNILTISTY